MESRMDQWTARVEHGLFDLTSTQDSRRTHWQDASAFRLRRKRSTTDGSIRFVVSLRVIVEQDSCYHHPTLSTGCGLTFLRTIYQHRRKNANQKVRDNHSCK
jgi:hypothetical protein